ncbi:flavin-containing monooxygenase [Phenylobacterium sp.]|jgi:cyclohexanone monooxygenase|uniref:flavin-containing monooxygenase n=1 Tax=Phenylobacterium sp. TaxID=1871053 RepID=UPI0037C6E255
MADGSRPPRTPISGETDVVVVGAGFGGLYMLHRLRAAGFAAQGFEAGGDVGGTWYWNRYPGARCDVPSLMYSYTWSEDLRREWRWTEKYAAQPEILAYANHVAARFDLRPLIAFETRVVSAHFDAAAGRWRVTTDRGDVVSARFVVMATGCLSVPRAPEIVGAADFAGPTYHTGSWPHEGVDFSGMRVAVIGTGSSAIQSIPQIAAQASHVTVFQRTPNFSVPANNTPLTEADRAAFEAMYADYIAMVKGPGMGFGNNPMNALPTDPEVRRQRYEELWGEGGAGFLTAWGNLLTDIEVNEEAAEFVRQKIGQTVKDPATARALAPTDHPIGTKRICVDIAYYETYNRPNVTLVDLKTEPLQAITADGVRTAAATYPADALVMATGFDAMTGALLAVDIRGRDGRTLKDAWAEGPKAYLGLSVAGFPNLFTITGPGSPSVLSNMINSIEQHVEWIERCLVWLRAEGQAVIEADDAAQEAWVDRVRQAAAGTLFPKAASWYMGANIPGKPRVFMPYIGPGYRATCDAVAAEGYRGFALETATVGA